MGTTHFGLGLDDSPGIREHAAKDANKNLDRVPSGRTPTALEFEAVIKHLPGFQFSIRTGSDLTMPDLTMIELLTPEHPEQRWAWQFRSHAMISIDVNKNGAGGRCYQFEKGSDLVLCLSILREVSKVAGSQCLFSSIVGNLVVLTEDSDIASVITEMDGPSVIQADPSSSGS